MDLFENQNIEIVDLNKNYKVILGDQFKPVRKVINSWAEGFIDRDNKFIKEFQTTFNSSFWELYCFAFIKKNGWTVDFSHHAPDFVISSENSEKFTIECTISNPPKNGLEESDSFEKIHHTMDIDASVDLSTIRLSNSINSKLKWFKKNKSKLAVLDNPFILAIAPFDQPNFQTANLQAINRVLFSHDRTLVINNEYYDFLKEEIDKSNGSSVPLGIFSNDSCKEISAVLFSCVATISKVRALSTTTDIAFIHSRYHSSTKQSMLGINIRLKYNNINEYYKKRAAMDVMLSSYKEIIDTDDEKYLRREPFIDINYKETLSDGLNLFLNPFAERPLSEQLINEFYQSGVNVMTYDVAEKIYIPLYVHEDSLYQRSCITLTWK